MPLKFYSEGFVVGSVIPIILLIFFAIVFKREQKKAKGKPVSDMPPSLPQPQEERGNRSQRLVKAFKISRTVIVTGCVLMLVAYVLITPIFPYSGTVAGKIRERHGTRGGMTVHYLVIDGEKKSVSENIFDEANKGDTVYQPAGRQWISVNGNIRYSLDYTWNTGFWVGFILISCLLFCGSIYYSALFKPPKWTEFNKILED